MIQSVENFKSTSILCHKTQEHSSRFFTQQAIMSDLRNCCSAKDSSTVSWFHPSLSSYFFCSSHKTAAYIRDIIRNMPARAVNTINRWMCVILNFIIINN